MDKSIAAILTVVVTILVVLVINYGIIRRYTGKNIKKARFWSRAINSTKNPWMQENQDLEELSRLVKKVTEQQAGKETQERNSTQG